jgi:hypothetical protein
MAKPAVNSTIGDGRVRRRRCIESPRLQRGFPTCQQARLSLSCETLARAARDDLRRRAKSGLGSRDFVRGRPMKIKAADNRVVRILRSFRVTYQSRAGRRGR